jgi:hypothetical protein
MRKEVLTLGIGSGVILFSLTLFEYFASGTDQLHFLTGYVEEPSVVLILSLALYIGVKARRTQSRSGQIGYGLALSSCAGFVWGLFTFLYIKIINPEYPRIIAQRSIPPNAQGAETTVLPAAVELLNGPVVQLVWKLVVVCLWGLLFTSILSAIYVKMNLKGARHTHAI